MIPDWPHSMKHQPPLHFIPSLHPRWLKTSDEAQHFTTAQMSSASQVIGSCLKKKNQGSRTALACHAPRRSDLTSDTRVTDLASDPQNVNK